MELKKIESISDVKQFAKLLKAELGLGFHPDDPFEDYINFQTREFTYSPKEAKLRNELIDQSFQVCTREQVDIYSVMGKVIVKGTPFKNCFE